MAPLISCIMPTRSRCDLAKRAVDGFLAQDYPGKELLILDDMTKPSFPKGIEHPTVCYVRGPSWTIGQKRNALCQSASGEFIAHFDSDDWSASQRLTCQFERLLASGKAVTGYRTMPFFQESTKRAAFSRGAPQYVLGSSLFFRKDWWARHRFPEKQIGEDRQFATVAARNNQLDAEDWNGLMVCRVHKDNTSPKHNFSRWKPFPLSKLPALFIEEEHL